MYDELDYAEAHRRSVNVLVVDFHIDRETAEKMTDQVLNVIGMANH